jgi:hypothetical protein
MVLLPFFVSRWQPIRDAAHGQTKSVPGPAESRRSLKQKTEKESTEQRKHDAPQPQRPEVDFEGLVIVGIGAVIMKSPKSG